MLAGSGTSPKEADRIGDRVVERVMNAGACGDEGGGVPGEVKPMRPSELREDGPRSPGTEPNIERKSEERGRCGKEAAPGELMLSVEPGCLSKTPQGRGKEL